jgi:uncharacterized protein
MTEEQSEEHVGVPAESKDEGDEADVPTSHQAVTEGEEAASAETPRGDSAEVRVLGEAPVEAAEGEAEEHQPSPAEQPPAVEEPTVDEEPTVVEEPLVVEEPPVVEEPTVVEERAAEEPTIETPVVEQPAAEAPMTDGEVPPEAKSLPAGEQPAALPEAEEVPKRPIPMPSGPEQEATEPIPMPSREGRDAVEPETSIWAERPTTGSAEEPIAQPEAEVGSGEAEEPPPGGPTEGPHRYFAEPGPGVAPMTQQDENRLAALAHASGVLNLITGVGGIAVALIIWLAYRDRSRYLAFQALQAAMFQLSVLVAVSAIAIIAAILWTIGLAMLVILIGVVIIIPAILATLIAIILPLGAAVYGVIGAVETGQGRPFRYWLVADYIPAGWYSK